MVCAGHGRVGLEVVGGGGLAGVLHGFSQMWWLFIVLGGAPPTINPKGQ